MAVRQERVVVQQEQRDDSRRPARALPDRVRVLGGHHAQRAAQLDQVLIALLAAQQDRVPRVGPQVVVAGNPDHRGEPLAEGGERPLDIRHELADVAGHQQPVVGRHRADAPDQLPVLGVAHVQVADREQSRPGRRVRSHVKII
jgi:hypothetical protein